MNEGAFKLEAVPDTSTWYTPDGRGATLTISRRRPLGKGNSGKVYEVVASLDGHKGLFAEKVFKDKETAEELATEAIQNYSDAKKAGLKVFQTYRLNEDKTRILMTIAESEDVICLSHYSDEEHKPWVREEDFAALCDNIFEQAELGSENNIALDEDAYFGLLSRSSGKIDFVVGNMDVVHNTGMKPQMKPILAKMNLESAAAFLSGLASKVFLGSRRTDMRAAVAALLDSRLRELEKEG